MSKKKPTAKKRFVDTLPKTIKKPGAEEEKALNQFLNKFKKNVVKMGA